MNSEGVFNSILLKSHELLRLKVNILSEIIEERRNSIVYKKLTDKNIKSASNIEEAIKIWDSKNEYMIYIDKISYFVMFKSEDKMTNVMRELFPTWSKVEVYMKKTIDDNPYSRFNNFIMVLPGSEKVDPAVTIHVRGNNDYVLRNFIGTMISFRRDYSDELLVGIPYEEDRIPNVVIAIHKPTEFYFESSKVEPDLRSAVLRKLDEPQNRDMEFIKKVAYTNGQPIEL